MLSCMQKPCHAGKTGFFQGFNRFSRLNSTEIKLVLVEFRNSGVDSRKLVGKRRDKARNEVINEARNTEP